MIPTKTKRQRKQKYADMLEEIIDKMDFYNSEAYPFGLCLLLGKVSGLSDDIENYPELIAQKPEKNIDGGYWFPRNPSGTEKRIQILIAAQIK